MTEDGSLYLPGEEVFGFFSSHMYSAFSRLSPMKKFHKFSSDTILSRRPSSVLDIGFGTGEVLRQLCSESSEMEIYGVEPSPHMLKVARTKLNSCRKSEGAVLDAGSSRKIPFQRKFDIIFSSLSFHHWENPEESLKYIMNYLNKGGSFLVFEFGKESLRGYKRLTASHALSIEYLKKFSGVAKYSVHDSGEYRCIDFRNPL